MYMYVGLVSMVTGDIEKVFFFIVIFNDFVKHGCLSTTQPAPRLTICFVLMCNNYMDGSGIVLVFGGCLKAHQNHI